MDTRVEQFQQSAAYVRNIIKADVETAIVLGSGLGKLADEIKNPIVIPYAHIPGFVNSTAAGHKGNLIYGTLGTKNVVAMQGRFHFYEGYSMPEVVFPIRVLYYLGVRNLFVSNAAGGVNPNFRLGDLMVITDHINLLPNPLIGKNIEEMGVRFPDMTRAYDRELIKIADTVAVQEKVNLQKGIYLASTGPTYETPAEYAFFSRIGADAVGMSTTPEVIAARHCGMRVFGMSVISNEAHSFSDTFVNDGNDVIEAANKAADTMTLIFKRIIEQL